MKKCFFVGRLALILCGLSFTGCSEERSVAPPASSDSMEGETADNASQDPKSTPDENELPEGENSL